MKKIVALILLIILSVALYGNGDVGFSFSFEDTHPIDFKVALSVRATATCDSIIYNCFQLELEKERKCGQYHNNIDILTTYKLSHIETNIKWLEIESRDLSVVGVDLRGRYKYGLEHSIGVAQLWIDNIPETNLVMGQKFHKELPNNSWLHKVINSTVPISISFSSDILTSDFKTFNYESSLNTKFALSALVSLNMKYRAMKYDKMKQSFKLEIKYRI